MGNVLLSVAACAKIFHAAGCKVILAGRNLEELKKVQKELQTSQDKVQVFKGMQCNFQSTSGIIEGAMGKKKFF